MNVEIGTEAPIFLFCEYLFQIFGILSMQCKAVRTSVGRSGKEQEEHLTHLLKLAKQFVRLLAEVEKSKKSISSIFHTSRAVC